MTSWKLARRSLLFFLRSHLGTVAGAAIATAVLTGALLVGDSVRGSLREMALARIGKIDFALSSGDRLFRSSINLPLSNAIVSAALHFPATASNPANNRRANQVQVTGVDENFWKMAQVVPIAVLSSNTAWINDRLAAHLGLKEHDTMLIRAPRVSHLSRDAPLAPEEDATVAIRISIGKIVSDAEFGRFGLQASQIPPFNIFVPRQLLQKAVNATNQANLLLVHSVDGKLDLQGAQKAFATSFNLADAQLSLSPAKAGELELRSSRVFLDNAVSDAALAASPFSQPILTYFVNELSVGSRSAPYSMVTGDDALLPDQISDSEIVINQWLADDLAAKPGDTLQIKYYVMGLMRELIERTNHFRIHSIVPMEMPYTDKTLMPDFPGMTDAENCRDWDTGFPINTSAIRDKDEKYWDQYRGAPKAFLPLHVAQNMWSNRFGNLTAIRYKTPPQPNILANLAPVDLGFVFRPIREEALVASSGSQDFGGLFIGFSFFLILAAIILMALLFRFGLEQRGVEIGTLLALGFTPKKVKRIFVLEGIGLALLGGALGVGGAIVYAKGMIHGLSTIWKEAVAGSALSFHANPGSLVSGFIMGALIALVTIWWSLRKEVKRPARELLSEGMENEFPDEIIHKAGPNPKPRKGMATGIIGVLCVLLALAITFWGLFSGATNKGELFFSAGAFMLIGGLALSSFALRKLRVSSMAEALSLTGMGLRAITRRHRRSRAAIGLLACGAFLIASIGAFRLDSSKDASKRSAGTGGFALIGETSIPVVHDLNSPAGRDFYGLGESAFTNVIFVPFRVLQGDDASCLNLNQSRQPQLLGVNPELLAQRDAFTFASLIDSKQSGVSIPPGQSPWLALNTKLLHDEVPAIGDAASIQYAMHKKVGDTIDYTDSNGRIFKVRIVGAIANSILQGSLIISEKAFVERFPTESGYRMFLIDAPSKEAEGVTEKLVKAMQDNGLEITPATERLAAYNAVQNTYLGTFQMLGGLGLLLGSFGLGIILLRNVFERRSELALLLALGFRKPALRWMILSEHAALLVIGLFVGIAAAIVAVLPALIVPGRSLPLGALAITIGAVFACGLVWTFVAAWMALRAPLLAALRNE
jgi:ABC-type antimicrobial peptide transport system permease subunit